MSVGASSTIKPSSMLPGCIPRTVTCKGLVAVAVLSIPWLSGCADSTESGSRLLRAAYQGNTQVVRALLDSGADVNATTTDGTTPLMVAASQGNVETAVALLDHSAEILAHDNRGHTALVEAALAGRDDLAQLLLRRGASIDELTIDRSTPTLIWWATRGLTSGVVLLLKSDADRNSKDQNGRRALAFAALGGHIATVEQLLGSGIPVDKPDASELTPIQLAAWAGHGDVVDLLAKAGARRDKYVEALLAIGVGTTLAKAGDLAGADQHYRRADSLDRNLSGQIWSNALNTMCWYGSLWGFADQVMRSCERAVALYPSDYNFADSRGLARALTGDVDGAIKDFEFFIAKAPSGLERTRRESWIEDLRGGRSPFTLQLLRELRDQ